MSLSVLTCVLCWSNLILDFLLRFTYRVPSSHHLFIMFTLDNIVNTLSTHWLPKLYQPNMKTNRSYVFLSVFCYIPVLSVHCTPRNWFICYPLMWHSWVPQIKIFFFLLLQYKLTENIILLLKRTRCCKYSFWNTKNSLQIILIKCIPKRLV